MTISIVKMSKQTNNKISNCSNCPTKRAVAVVPRDIAYRCCRCPMMYLLVSSALLCISAATLQLVRFHYFCSALNLFTAEVAVALTLSVMESS